MLKCIVLDFDGTLTDVHAEAQDFAAEYKSDIAQLMHRLGAMAPSDLDAHWQRALDTILATPDRYGWWVDGKIVAPPHTDPYILPTCISHVLFDNAGLLPAAEERVALTQAIFQRNYANARTVFRAGAAAAVQALLDCGVPVRVVTNSHPEAVRRKLAQLGIADHERVRVHGNARKYALSASTSSNGAFARIAESVTVSGLTRPVYLRRGNYFDVLQSLWDETGASAATTLVCGDIYELDLALPAALGCWVHLVTRDSTAPYEKHAIAQHPRGSSGDDVQHILQRVEQLCAEKSERSVR